MVDIEGKVCISGNVVWCIKHSQKGNGMKKKVFYEATLQNLMPC